MITSMFQIRRKETLQYICFARRTGRWFDARSYSARAKKIKGGIDVGCRRNHGFN
jgi:hypothetical protein